MKRSYKLIIIVLLTGASLSCASPSQGQSELEKTVERSNSIYEQQFREIANLKQSMTEYMETAQPSYTEKDIAQCALILTEFIDNIDKTTSKEAGLELVKTAVIKLNELNEQCDFQLIETGEREQIAAIIIATGNKKGYNTLSEDITEAWREW